MRRRLRQARAGAAVSVAAAATVALSSGLAWAMLAENSATQTNSFGAGTLATPTTTSIHPTVSGTSSGDVQLTWTDALTRGVTFLVQRAPATSPTSWTTLTTIASSTCSGPVPGTVSCTWTDTTSSYNKQYAYQVQARIGGWSALSGGDLASSLPPTSGTETYPAPVGFAAVAGVSASSVWAVGADCTVDYFNGASWTVQAVPTTVCPAGTALTGIAANSGAPMIVGAGGLAILCTAACTSASPTWSTKNTGVAVTLNAVAAKDASDMWAVGENCTVLFFNGTTWNQQAPSGPVCPAGTSLYGVTNNAANPVVAGAGGILFTCTATCTATPTWTADTVSGLTGSPDLYAATFVGGNAWVAGQNGTLAVCTGNCNKPTATWTTQASNTTNTLRAIVAQASTNVYTAGANGTLLQCTATCNASGNWTALSSGTTLQLAGITSPVAAAAWAVGQAGTIITNTGTGWTSQDSNTSDNLAAVAGASASSVWAVGADCTVDYYNGASWTVQAVPTAVCPTGTALTGIAANGGAPMIVGAGGVAFLCTAACTTSSPTWTVKPTGVTATLNAVAAKDASDMWAVGANCTVLFFNGTGWTSQTPTSTSCPAGTSLYGVTNNANPIVTGGAGTVLTCTATCTGTPTWTADAVSGLAGSPDLYGATFIGGLAWAAGQSGTIAVCTGNCTKPTATWTTQASGTSVTLRTIAAQATTNVYAAGADGTVLQCTATCNAAGNWTALNSGTGLRLAGVTSPVAAAAWAVGQAGTIITNTGNGWAGQDSNAASNTTTSVALPAADLADLAAPDGSYYVNEERWPATGLGSNCNTGLLLQAAATIPAGTWAVNRADVTVTFQASDTPGPGSGFQLLASGDGGATWDAYPLSAPGPDGAAVTDTVAISTTISTITKLSNMRLCFQGISGVASPLTTSIDLVHVDVN